MQIWAIHKRRSQSAGFIQYRQVGMFFRCGLRMSKLFFRNLQILKNYGGHFPEKKEGGHFCVDIFYERSHYLKLSWFFNSKCFSS